MSRSSNLLAAAAVAFLVAAIFATTLMWPDTGSLDDVGPDRALQAYALITGALLLVPAAVCWVGSVIVARLDALAARKS